MANYVCICMYVTQSCPWECSTSHIIGYYKPSVRIIDVVSHTTYVVCVNFIHKWRDLQSKVDSERRIFWEIFHGKFLFTLRVFAKNLLRGNRRWSTFRIFFLCLAWDSNLGFSSNKPTHYLLNHGEGVELVVAQVYKNQLLIKTRLVQKLVTLHHPAKRRRMLIPLPYWLLAILTIKG